ncbi:MAG: PIN domain-containing protein [Archaeoglobi archaeon]|nr:PIN domain-containing protein [Archaeoglobi archaeon]
MSGVFIDSTLFLKVLEGDSRAKETFLKLYEKEKLYRNAVVFSEVLFVWLKLSTGKKSYELRKFPELVRSSLLDFQKVRSFIDLAHSLPLTEEIEDLASEFIFHYGLLPNDALIAATCKHYGINKIATFDDDFKRLDFLEIVDIR